MVAPGYTGILLTVTNNVNLTSINGSHVYRNRIRACTVKGRPRINTRFTPTQTPYTAPGPSRRW